MTIFQPVDVLNREARNSAIKDSSATTVCYLLGRKDRDSEGGCHLQHMLHYVLIHLKHEVISTNRSEAKKDRYIFSDVGGGLEKIQSNPPYLYIQYLPKKCGS